MGINIPLFDGWRILSDKYQYILAQESKDRISHDSFYISIEDCILGFIEKKIKGFDSTSIVGLLNSIKLLQARLNEALQPLNIRVRSEKEHIHPAHIKDGQKNGNTPTT